MFIVYPLQKQILRKQVVAIGKSNSMHQNNNALGIAEEFSKLWSLCISFHHRFFLWQGSCSYQYIYILALHGTS